MHGSFLNELIPRLIRDQEPHQLTILALRCVVQMAYIAMASGSPWVVQEIVFLLIKKRKIFTLGTLLGIFQSSISVLRLLRHQSVEASVAGS